MLMCLFHCIWVSCLGVCQIYQVIFLAMTTNERMNASRYRHFQRGTANLRKTFCDIFILIMSLLQWGEGCTSLHLTWGSYRTLWTFLA